MKVLLQIIFNLFLAIDQMLNAILLGHPDETLSSRLGRTRGCERYFWVSHLRVIINTILFFDVEYLLDGRIKRHCEKSIMPLEQQNFREFVDYEIWSWNK